MTPDKIQADVERFALTRDGLFHDTDGDYVKYDDYAALSARIERQEAALAAISKEARKNKPDADKIYTRCQQAMWDQTQ